MSLVRNGRLLGRVHYAFVVMACCCLIQAFGMGLIMNCGSLFYVPVCEDLGFLRSEIATYMTGYFIGTTLVTPLAGKLLSRYDMRPVMAVAAIVLAGSIAAMSTYSHVWQWQISGFLVGATGAFLFVLPSATLIGNWFVERRGLAYGVTMACSGVSATVFSQVISFIIQGAGWRPAYVFVALASLAVLLPCSLIIRRDPSDMGAAPYGSCGLGGGEEVSPKRGVAVKVALGSLAFWCLFAFAGIASFIHGGIEQHMPGYIQSIGFTASFAALVVSAESAGSVMDKLLMGWLNDRIGVRLTTVVELIVVMMGIVGFVCFRDPVLLVISTVLFGVQDSLMTVSLPLLVREVFGDKNYTQILAWMRAGAGVFGASSGIIVGFSFDSLGTFAPALLLLAGACLLAVVCVLLAYGSKKKLAWRE